MRIASLSLHGDQLRGGEVWGGGCLFEKAVCGLGRER